jgi:cytoskeleton-associated protein 5
LLLDFEVAVLVPLLCEKSGLNNQLLKDKAKKLLRMAFDVCDKQMCYNFIVGQGLQSKNLNAIAECLDELAEFIIRNGIDYSSDKEMKLIARLADSPSKNVRESAVKALGEAFKLLDDNIWRVIGDVTPKVQGLLEARFKKIKGGPALNTLYASASMASF